MNHHVTYNFFISPEIIFKKNQQCIISFITYSFSNWTWNLSAHTSIFYRGTFLATLESLQKDRQRVHSQLPANPESDKNYNAFDKN